jgi:hypothetical protein
MISMAPEISNRATTIFRNMASSTYSNSFRPSHHPARQAHHEEFSGLGGDGSLAPSQSAHEKDRNRDRLEDRSLNFLRPTTQTAPDRHNDVGEAGEPTKHAIEDSGRGVGSVSSRSDGPKVGTNESDKSPETVDDGENADCNSDAPGIEASIWHMS